MGYEFGVDIFEELRQMRTVQYESWTHSAEEILQNCQRSGAKRVDVTIEDDRLVVRDDGVGCSDPAVLFIKNRTGWAEGEVWSPYGQGLFSVYMIADCARFESAGRAVETNIEDVLRKRDLGLITEYASRIKKGFRLTLTDMRECYDAYDMQFAIEQVAIYLPIRVYINGVRVQQENPVAVPADRGLVHKVDLPGIKGWLAPKEFTGVTVFYDYREVGSLYGYPGMGGRIMVDDGVLNFRAPDRKAVIHDSRYITWDVLMKKLRRKLYMKVVKAADDETLARLGERIVSILDVSDYANELLYLIDRDGKAIQMLNDKAEKDEITSDTKGLGVEITEIIEGSSPICRVSLPGGGIRTGEKVQGVKPGFFVKVSDYPMYVNEVQTAKYHGCPIGIARNDAEVEGFKYHGWLPIAEIEDRVILDTKFTPMPPDSHKESRAYELLRSLVMETGYQGVVALGRVEAERRYVSEKGDVMFCQPVQAVALFSNGKVLLDKGKMHMERCSKAASKELNKQDIKWLAGVLPHVAHELAHALGHNDGTVEHAEATLDVLQLLWAKALGL